MTELLVDDEARESESADTPPDLPESETATMGRRTVRAALWAFFAAAGKRVITLGGLVVLGRILAPHDFGLLGFAMLYIGFAETIGDIGTTRALIYWPDRREDAAQITFAINIVMGIFWCIVTLMAAPALSRFFHAAGDANIVRALSPLLLIKFLGNTHDGIAQREMRFRARSAPELALAATKIIVSLIFGLLGFGAWSLVWGQLAALGAWTTILWIIVPWRPQLRFPIDLLMPMLRYGRSIVAVNVLAALMFDFDLTVVGRFLGVTALGLYQMAIRIPEATVVVILWVTSEVLFPAFSRLHAAGESVNEAYLVAVRSVSALTLPAAFGIFFLSKPIILVFLGAKWLGSAPILSVLALYVAIRSIDHHAGDVLKATGRAHLLAVLGVIRVALMIPSEIAGGILGGGVGVAAALVISYSVASVITLITAARMIHVRFIRILTALGPSVKATAAMSAALFLWMLASRPLLPVVQLSVGIVIGLATYFFALRLIDAELVGSAVAILSRRPRRAAAA